MSAACWERRRGNHGGVCFLSPCLKCFWALRLDARAGRARLAERARKRRAWTSAAWGWQWPWGSSDIEVRRIKKDAARREIR